MKENNTFALVTGASRGLGREIAYSLARRKYNLLLVSLKNENLGKICDDLNYEFGVKAFKFEGNLLKTDTVYNIAKWAANFNVSILINNAGIGGTIPFEEATPEYIDNIIQINVRATTLLTRLMIPQLKVSKKAFILNVGSIASFSPIPFKTVYPASKAFINSFSKSLSQELKGSNISVSVIHPGPMRTNPEVIKRIERQGFFARLHLIPAKDMAEVAIRKMFSRTPFILPGFFNNLSHILLKIVPFRIRSRVLSVVYKREILKESKINMAS